MLSALATFVDRRITNAILARAKRRSRLLGILPAAWLRPLVRPAATQIRHEISRTAAATVAIVGVLIAILLLVGGQ